MKILVDVGNSRIGLAAYESGAIKRTLFITTNKNATDDELLRIYNSLLEDDIYSLKNKTAESILISSVVPSLNHALGSALERLFKTKAKFVSPGIKTGLILRTDNPNEIGADIICDSIAAKEIYSYPTAIIDLGTATKILFIDKNGAFSGAIIAPGLRLSAKSLFDGASLLPNIELKMPKKVVGKNTIDCMTSGIVYGHYSMIKGLLENAEKEFGYTFKKVLTGGNSYPFLDIFQENGYIYDANLVFKGLEIIDNKNSEGK